MALNPTLLRNSFDLVKRRGYALTENFYEILFTRYPSVQPLFADVDMAEQPKKLLASLALVLANLEKPDVLAPALAQMGERHVGYGAEPAHYPAVGECLLLALARTVGEAWNPELEAAWAEAYAAVVLLMTAALPVA